MKIVARQTSSFSDWQDIMLSGYSVEYMARALAVCRHDSDYDDEHADCGFTTSIAEVLISKSVMVEDSELVSFKNGVLVFSIDYYIENDQVRGNRTAEIRVMEA